MLCRVVAGDSTLDEGTGECLWIGGVEEVGDVEVGGGEAVEDADSWGGARR